MTAKEAARAGAGWWEGLPSAHKLIITVVALVTLGVGAGAWLTPLSAAPSDIRVLQGAMRDSIGGLPARVSELEDDVRGLMAARDSTMTYLRWLACLDRARELRTEDPHGYCVARFEDPLSTIGPGVPR